MKNFNQGEPIERMDKVPEAQKEAFEEMLSDIDLTKNKISEDPQLRLEIEKMIETLPTEKEKDVIRRRFFGGETLKEIGESYGVGLEPIRKQEARALRHLRNPGRLKFIEDVRLENRDKVTYSQRLYNLINRFRNEERGKEAFDLLNEFGGFLYGGLEKGINKLDSQFFNQVFDDVKKVCSSKNVNIVELRAIFERLKKETLRIYKEHFEK